jgi:hypothetical protein
METNFPKMETKFPRELLAQSDQNDWRFSSTLTTSAMSAIGTKQTFRPRLRMSAFGQQRTKLDFSLGRFVR